MHMQILQVLMRSVPRECDTELLAVASHISQARDMVLRLDQTHLLLPSEYNQVCTQLYTMQLFDDHIVEPWRRRFILATSYLHL
jgi:hypothetical protein